MTARIKSFGLLQLLPIPLTLSTPPWHSPAPRQSLLRVSLPAPRGLHSRQFPIQQILLCKPPVRGFGVTRPLTSHWSVCAFKLRLALARSRRFSQSATSVAEQITS